MHAYFSRFLEANLTNETDITSNSSIIPDTNQGNQGEMPYISTEFFYNLLPCYLFILTSLYRMITIYKEPAFKEKFQALAQQNNQANDIATPGWAERQSKSKIIISNMENDLDQIEEKTASYYIKTRLSFANSFLYILAVIFSFTLTPDLFSVAVNPDEGLFYLFGVVAWYFSGKLVKMEFERGLNQEIYTHRFFWVFAGSLALIRIFQRSERPVVNVVMNSIRFVLIFFLMIYAIYKPFDRELEMGIVEDEMPTWARSFFDKLESNRFVAKLVGYNPKTLNLVEREMTPALDVEELTETREKFHQLLNERRNSNVVQNVNQEQFLLKNLPKRRVVGLSKLPIKKRVNNNETKVFYQIITQIDQNRYLSEKKYSEFQALEKELIEIYNEEDFPNLYDKLPILEKVDINELTDEQQFMSRRIEYLEKYLQALFKSPAFIHPKVLIFLEVSEDDRTSFLAYFSYISKSLYQNKRKLSRTLNDIQSGSKPMRRKSSLLNENQNFELNRLDKSYKKNFAFDITCVDWQKSAFADYYEFIFLVTNLNNTSQNWRICKTLASIREFHDNLEGRTGFSIVSFAKFVPKSTMNDKSTLDLKKEGLNKYMKELAGNKKYYCDVFFEFIEFNPVKETPYNNENRPSRKDSDFDEIGISTMDEEFYYTFDDCPTSQISLPKKMMNKKNVFPEKKLVSGIDFENVIVRVVGVKSSAKPKNELNGEGKNESIVHYFLNLEEFYEPKNNEFLLKTVVKVKKVYHDFENLFKKTWDIYRDISDINIPTLPAQKLVVHGVTKFDPKERKQTWETFFFNLLRIPRIEENEFFKEFFNLDKLDKGQNYYRSEKETHDFT